MKVSVIIPTYTIDRLNDIHKVVESISEQTCMPMEVIIPVDHNEKLAKELTNYYRLNKAIKVVLNNGIIGGAETRNVGIRNSEGDIVAFTDDDAVVDKDWLGYLVAQYENPDVMAVGGKTIAIWENGRPSWFPEELDWLVGGTWKGHREDYGEVRNLIGPNMSFRRDVCNRIGYMRSELGALGSGFRAGDETEFYIRLKSLIPTGKIIYEPKAVVCHKVSGNKTRWTIIITRSYSLGFYKKKASKILSVSTYQPFKTESEFLKYLILSAIPRKLVQVEIRQALAIVISIIFVGFGYLRGKCRMDECEQ